MQISEQVLSVLSSLEINSNSQSPTRASVSSSASAWTITMTKLERGLYLKVDQVLQAMGGRWDRKTKAHVFAVDPNPIVEQVLALGEITTHKDLGFFRTPKPLARRLVEMADVRPGHIVLEPSAGDGAIVEAIVEHQAAVLCIERDKGRRVKLFARASTEWLTVSLSMPPLDIADDDFMDYEPSEPFDRVVMNPPFLKCGKGDHLDHVRHAFSMLVPGGILVSVLPKGVDFRQDRRHREFREWCYDAGRIGTATTATRDLPEDAFKESGTGVRTVVLRLVKP